MSPALVPGHRLLPQPSRSAEDIMVAKIGKVPATGLSHSDMFRPSLGLLSSTVRTEPCQTKAEQPQPLQLWKDVGKDVAARGTWSRTQVT